MTKTSSLWVATLVALLSLVSPRLAAQLPSVIDKNIESAQSASERLGDPTKATPQLWIHVRSASQEQEVKAKLDWFQRLKVDGRSVRVRPIQVVTDGPQQTQLRFFKAADRAMAQLLVAQLKKPLPGIALQDMSTQYRQVSWIEPGHVELWLAPGVTRIMTR